MLILNPGDFMRAPLVKAYLSTAHVIVHCMALDDKHCVENLKFDFFQNRRNYNAKAPIILVGTKIDLRDKFADNPGTLGAIENPRVVSYAYIVGMEILSDVGNR